MVHDGACSTKCQPVQRMDDSSTQPKEGPHAQPMGVPYAHPKLNVSVTNYNYFYLL